MRGHRSSLESVDRRQIIGAVADVGFGSGRCVTYPDHPLLSRGPDILGLADGVLSAWFVSTSRSGRSDSKAESARVLLSRLALPRGTRLVSVRVAQPVLASQEVELFDEVQTRNPDGSLVDRHNLGGEAAFVAELLRPFQFERFSKSWTRTRAGSVDGHERRGRSTVDLRRSRLERLPRWAEVHEEGLFAYLGAELPQRAVQPRVQSLAVAMTTIDYDLPNGLRGVFETATLLERGDAYLGHHVMSLEPRTSRHRTGDPYKPFRAAAFAGAQVTYPEAN